MTKINGQILGQFKSDKKNGKGSYYYDSGNTYVGSWVNDQKVGQGVFTWPNGDRYETICSHKIGYHFL
jgi:hypothetical protein